jgi:hypothetical protein
VEERVKKMEITKEQLEEANARAETADKEIAAVLEKHNCYLAPRMTIMAGGAPEGMVLTVARVPKEQDESEV